MCGRETSDHSHQLPQAQHLSDGTVVGARRRQVGPEPGHIEEQDPVEGPVEGPVEDRGRFQIRAAGEDEGGEEHTEVEDGQGGEVREAHPPEG